MLQPPGRFSIAYSVSKLLKNVAMVICVRPR